MPGSRCASLVKRFHRSHGGHPSYVLPADPGRIPQTL